MRPAIFRGIKSITPFLPKRIDYRLRVAAERRRFEQGYHAPPKIAGYWSKTYVQPMMQSLGVPGLQRFFMRELFAGVARADAEGRTCRLLSLGSGDCAWEIRAGQRLVTAGHDNFEFLCLDIDQSWLNAARKSCADAGLAARFKFERLDIRSWKPAASYDVVIVRQFLHHVVALEDVLDKVAQALRPDGRFVVADMIGRNGHMLWPEALTMVNELWADLPERYKYNHLYGRTYRHYDNVDHSSVGFEGIRAQDILPLLVERFQFTDFLGFANIVDAFIGRPYGPNFDPDDEGDRAFIDRVHQLDQEGIETGRLKPTHMLAVMTTEQVAPPRVYKKLTPEFCIRWPDKERANEVRARIV